MKQITEDYVGYEIAQLLKEKGFDEKTIKCFSVDGELLDIINDTYGGVKPANWNGMSDKDYGYIGLRNWYGSVSAPTHQMTLKWLREVYGLYINLDFGFVNNEKCAVWSIVRCNNSCVEFLSEYTYEDTYEQAVEAALLYVLKNLI